MNKVIAAAVVGPQIDRYRRYPTSLRYPSGRVRQFDYWTDAVDAIAHTMDADFGLYLISQDGITLDTFCLREAFSSSVIQLTPL